MIGQFRSKHLRKETVRWHGNGMVNVHVNTKQHYFMFFMIK